MSELSTHGPRTAASRFRRFQGLQASVTTRAAIAGGWISFVLATEHWRPWGDSVRLQYATDVEEYETIARAAPGFPDVKIQVPHSDRFPPNWLVGEIHHLLHVGLHPVYWVATGLTVLCLLATMDATLRTLRASATTYALAFGALAASAYPLRYLLDAPGMLTDALFVLGLALVVHAFRSGRFELVLVGLAVATLGRQTGLPLAVVAAVGVALDGRWRARRWPYAALTLVVPFLFYAVPHEASRSWADTTGRGIVGMSLAGNGTWTNRELAVHVARCIVAIAIPAALIVVGWLRGHGRPLWLPLALGACVFLQAVALAPDWTHAEPRLAGLALPALIVAAVPSLDRTALRPFEVVLVTLGIALASLHHLYTNLGVHTTGEWGALVTVGCLLVLSPLATTRLSQR